MTAGISLSSSTPIYRFFAEVDGVYKDHLFELLEIWKEVKAQCPAINDRQPRGAGVFLFDGFDHMDPEPLIL